MQRDKGAHPGDFSGIDPGLMAQFIALMEGARKVMGEQIPAILSELAVVDADRATMLRSRQAEGWTGRQLPMLRGRHQKISEDLPLWESSQLGVSGLQRPTGEWGLLPFGESVPEQRGGGHAARLPGHPAPALLTRPPLRQIRPDHRKTGRPHPVQRHAQRGPEGPAHRTQSDRTRAPLPEDRRFGSQCQRGVLGGLREGACRSSSSTASMAAHRSSAEDASTIAQASGSGIRRR